jgi:predicted nucleic acid-binding protein
LAKAERVYLETTIISYITARPSRDVVVAGHQMVTRSWWDYRKPAFSVFVSELVVQEAKAGDAEAAKARLELISDLAVLHLKPIASALAKDLLVQAALPAKAVEDALHIAICASHGIEFLLTWNCKHLANARMRPIIERVCKSHHLPAPIICTPEELMEGPS